jgi:hypothetical protein
MKGVRKERVNDKKGRPPKQGVSRTKKMNMRLTEQELEDIEKCAETLGISRTDTVMSGIELLKAEIEKRK